MLVAVAAGPIAAERIPTRWIELEDRQVVKQGGRLYPDPWIPYRPRYRGGWSLAPGDSVRAPVVPGGERASLSIDVRIDGVASEPIGLRVLQEDTLLAPFDLGPQRRWQTVQLERIDWIAGADLILEVDGGLSGDDRGRIVVDRVRFSWR